MNRDLRIGVSCLSKYRRGLWRICQRSNNPDEREVGFLKNGVHFLKRFVILFSMATERMRICVSKVKYLVLIVRIFEDVPLYSRYKSYHSLWSILVKMPRLGVFLSSRRAASQRISFCSAVTGILVSQTFERRHLVVPLGCLSLRCSPERGTYHPWPRQHGQL